VAARRARFAVDLGGLEVLGDNTLEGGLGIKLACQPSEEREPVPDELAVVDKLCLAFDVVEYELFPGVMQRSLEVLERNAIRRK